MADQQLDERFTTWLGAEDWLVEILPDLHRKYKNLRDELEKLSSDASPIEYYGRVLDNYYKLAMMFYPFCEPNNMYVKVFSQFVDKYSSCMRLIDENDVSDKIKKQLKKLNHNLSDFESEEYKPIALNTTNHSQYIDQCIETGCVTNNAELDQIMSECSDEQKRKVQNIQLLHCIISLQDATLAAREMQPLSRILQYRKLASAFAIVDKFRSIKNSYLKDADTLENQLAQSSSGPPTKLTASQFTELIENELNDKECDFDKLMICVMANIKNQTELSESDIDFIKEKYITFYSTKWLADVEKKLETLQISLNEIAIINLDLFKANAINAIPPFFQEFNYYKKLSKPFESIGSEREKELLTKLKEIFERFCLAKKISGGNELGFASKLIEFLNSFTDLDAITASLELEKFCQDDSLLHVVTTNILNYKTVDQSRAFIELQNAAKALKDQTIFNYLKDIQRELIAYLQPIVVKESKINEINVIEVVGNNVAISRVIDDVETKLGRECFDEIRFVGGNIIHVDANLKHEIWHGKNVVVYSPKAVVHGAITWDVSGEDNMTQQPARTANDSSTNEDGTPGRDGFAGESGGNVLLSILHPENFNNLTIICNGGKGSDGEDGGNGRHGENGTGVKFSELKEDIDDKLLYLVEHPGLYNFKGSKIIKNFRNLFFPVKAYIYKEYETSDKIQAIVSRCAWRNPIFKLNSYVLYKGSPGSSGGKGGAFGLGGQGGFPGNVEMSDKIKLTDIKVHDKHGDDGKNGKNGKHGYNGKNGWDLGYVGDNTAIVFNKKNFFGKNEDSKVTIEYVSKPEGDISPFCGYQESLGNPCYVKMSEGRLENKIGKKNSEQIKCRAKSDRQHHALATRKKNISQDEIVSSYSHIVSNNQLESLKSEHSKTMQSIYDQQAESHIEEQTEVTIKRMNVHNKHKSKNYDMKDFLPPKTITTTPTVEDELKNISLVLDGKWFVIQTLILDFDQLCKTIQDFNNLRQKDSLVDQSDVSKVEKLLSDKYRFAICYEIAKKLAKINAVEFPEKGENKDPLNSVRIVKGKKYVNILAATNLITKKSEFDKYLKKKKYESEESKDSNSNVEDCIEINVEEILKFFANEDEKLKLRKELKEITFQSIGQNGILRSVFNRFSVEGCHITADALSCLINSISQSAADNRTNELNIVFHWIVAAYPQKQWIDELALVQIENYFNTILQEESEIRECLSQIENKGVLATLIQKLQVKKTQSTTVDNLQTTLHLLKKSKHVENQLKFKEFDNWINILISTTEEQSNVDQDQHRSVKNIVNIIYEYENTMDSVKENLGSLESNLEEVESTSFIKDEFDIPDWIKSIQKQTDNRYQLYVEMIAVIDEVIFIKRKFRLRDTQKVAVLILLTHQRNVLEQVTTGEGKSLIVVAAAIAKALCGDKVDIITSSPVLAVRDAEENRDIYALFEINVYHNCENAIGKRRKAYSSNQVVYGVLSNFQRDYLLDRFYGKNILGDRSFANVIIDEVDSMLLDRGVNMLYLTHDMPGMDTLESVYIFIWEKINSRTRNMQEVARSLNQDLIKELVLRDMFGLITKEDLKEIDPQWSDYEINSLWRCLIEANVIDEEGLFLIENETNYNLSVIKLPQVVQHRADRIDFLVFANIRRKREINVPTYLKPFVVRHLESWISNAFNAFNMTDRVDYVVDVDRSGTSSNRNAIITILDKDTGADQTNSEWSDALHQFLQLKHGCKITPQSLKSVFISNISYFKLYKHLYGLTGTLGSQTELKILKKMHKVDFVTIPTTRERKFKERPAILCRDPSDWIDALITNAKMVTTEEKRSVLIICESVLDVEDLRKSFAKRHISNVITYTREYKEFEFKKSQTKLEPATIIIATNLAGRGTDIKLSEELQKAGGLHVCLTYLPSNKRVEEQAFGRAARCGEEGTGQLIIVPPNVNHYKSFTIEMYKNCRDRIEQDRLDEINKMYKTEIKTEEDCFKQFQSKYETLKKDLERTTISKQILEFIVQKLMSTTISKQIQEFLLQCCLDDWAFWLNENGKIITAADDAKDNLKCKLIDFLNRMEQQPINNWSRWRTNPFQKVVLAQHCQNEDKHDEAIRLLDEVIRDEPIFSAAAHYYKAYSLLKSTSEINLIEVRDELRKSLNLFEKYVGWATNSSALITNLKLNRSDSIIQINAFELQQQSLCNIYNAYIQSIYSLIGKIITPATFVSDSVNEMQASILFSDLQYDGILNKPKVTANIYASAKEVKNLENDYGLAKDRLLKHLKSFGNIALNEKQFKVGLSLPSRELFWKNLIQINFLYDEVKYVAIDKTQWNKVASSVSDSVRMQRMQYSDDFIFMYEVKNAENQFVFIKNVFIDVIGKEKYKTLKDMQLISFNKKAKVDVDKIDETNSVFPNFDGITAADFDRIHCTAEEAKLILKHLEERKVLKGNSENNIYRLQKRYNEIDDIDLPSFPLYKGAVVTLLRLCFPFRFALQQLVDDFEKIRNGDVQIQLESNIHRSLYYDLMSQNIITPVSVNAIDLENKLKKLKENKKLKILNDTKQIDEFKNIEKNLQDSKGQLMSTELKSYRLKSLAKHCGNQKNVNAEELQLVSRNGFNHVIESYKPILQKIIILGFKLAKLFVGFIKSAITVIGKIGNIMTNIKNLASSITLSIFNWNSIVKVKDSIQNTVASISDVYKAGWKTMTMGWKLISTAYKKTKELFFNGEDDVERNVSVKQLFHKTRNLIDDVRETESKDLIFTNHLKKVCNFISDDVLRIVNDTFVEHSITNALKDACSLYEETEAIKMLDNLTSEFFTPLSLEHEFEMIAKKLSKSAQHRILNDLKTTKISKIEDWTEHLKPNFLEIKSMITQFLDSIPILEPEKRTEIRKLKEMAPEEMKIDSWKSILKEGAREIVEEHIVNPLQRLNANIQQSNDFEKRFEEMYQ